MYVTHSSWLLRQATSPSAPLRGGVPVSGSNCSRVGGNTILSFQRSAKAAGGRQAPISLGAPQQIVWSVGDEGDSTLSSLEGPVNARSEYERVLEYLSRCGIR